MGYPTRIATCCYCGSRAALVLDKSRHELSCSNCGAPLHDMKRFRSDPAPDQPRQSRGATSRRPLPEYPREDYVRQPRKPQKRRKSTVHRFMKEVIDLVEDIFD